MTTLHQIYTAFQKALDNVTEVERYDLVCEGSGMDDDFGWATFSYQNESMVITVEPTGINLEEEEKELLLDLPTELREIIETCITC